MKKFSFSLVLILLPLLVYADLSIHEPLKQALESYKNEKYTDTIREYEILILEGFNNPDIYYNLSNAYYKNNDLGRAGLNLERALRLSPRDKDIQYNRNFVANLAGEPELNIAESIVKKVKLLFSLNELTVIVSILFIFLSISFGAYCLTIKTVFFKISVLLAIIFVLASLILYAKIYDEIITQEAVVLSNTQVRNKPIKKEDVAFEVIAGRKIVILEELGRWANVKLSVNGLSGWLEKNYIEKI